MANTLRRDLWTGGLVALSTSLLLFGYEFVRSTSNSLFKQAYGVEGLPYVMALVVPTVAVVVYGYGRALTRLGPRRTLLASTLASAASIGLCYVAIRGGSKVATGVLFLVREAYVVLLIEQYWSLINSTYDRDRAPLFNGPIAGVGSIGAIIGGVALSKLAVPLGAENMLLFAAASLVPAAWLSDRACRRAGEPRPSPEEEGGAGGPLALGLFRSRPVLLYLLGIVVVSQVVSAVLGLRFQGILQEVYPDVDEQTAYSGGFFAWINAAAAFLQFVGGPLVLRFVSFQVVFLTIPLVHAVLASVLLVAPSLQTAGGAYLWFKALDYSVFRIAKEIFYIPLSFDARYRAKEVVDVVGYRWSKGGTALAIALIQRAGYLFQGAYAGIAVAATAVWLGLAVGLARARREVSR